MSEPVANGAAAEANGPTFSVEKIYVKDVSFEAPGAPQVFNEQGQPALEMNLNQRVQRLADNLFEVELGVTLTCKLADKTVYLAEVRQAGLFGLGGFDDQNLDAMLGIHCPTVLYPTLGEALDCCDVMRNRDAAVHDFYRAAPGGVADPAGQPPGQHRHDQEHGQDDEVLGGHELDREARVDQIEIVDPIGGQGREVGWP